MAMERLHGGGRDHPPPSDRQSRACPRHARTERVHTEPVPLIDITYDQSVGEDLLRQLRELLPDVVAEAVECPEEPWTGPPEPGDIEIRFREKSPLDAGELSVVIEVRTKFYASRVEDKQRRVDLLRDRLADLNIGRLGVWLILTEGAWSQA
jgi:hypothetical protein